MSSVSKSGFKVMVSFDLVEIKIWIICSSQHELMVIVHQMSSQ